MGFVLRLLYAHGRRAVVPITSAAARDVTQIREFCNDGESIAIEAISLE